MKRLILSLMVVFFSGLLLVFISSATYAAPMTQLVTSDMISPRSDLGQCLTVNGTDPSSAPQIVLGPCRGTAQQRWTHNLAASQWQTELNTSYCLATVNSSLSAGGSLTVRLCTDSRALTLTPNPTLTDSYRISGTTYVLDWGVYGKVAVASENGWDYQFFRWLQPDLGAVNSLGCAITYPFTATDTATYNRELACDHVAKLQPPYQVPAAAQRDPSIFPGVVPAGSPLVSGRTFTFNLQFQDNGYARMSVPPSNWKSTGLYAPAGQIITVTVNNANASDLNNVYVQLGVHTDVLQPTSNNVVNGQFLRYPNVVTRIRLQPGANQMRTPYGGLIILVSTSSLSKTIDLQIDNVVEAPYFVAGQTTEAEWLARRTAPAPWGEIESNLAVLSVASSQLSVLSFAEVSEMAQFYSNITRYHNEVSGLSDSAAIPNLFPQGQQRFVTDKQIALGSAHSGYPTMFFDSYLLGTPLDTILRSTDTDWGMFHEFGHNYQMGAWSGVYGTETTVNIFSLHAQEKFFGNSRLVDSNIYASAIAILNNPAVTNKWNSADAFQKLVFIDQLRLGFPDLDWGFWQEVMRRYRAMTSTEYNALNTDPLKYDKFMTIACDVTNSNLTPHFNAWTVPVSQTAKDYCASKPALTRQIWLIDNAQPLWYHPGTGSGGFLRETWSGMSGSSILSLTSNSAYPNSPTTSAIITTSLEGTQNFADNYGERLRGYLHPPVTGAYRFWISGDDSAQLLLSTDADPLHATPILTLTTYSGYRNFDNQNLSVQRSAEIQLVAGQKYYIEVLHKESTGGDSVSVAWNIPATPGLPGEIRKLIAAQYLSPYAGDLALTKSLAPGQASTIQPGSDAAFQLQVSNLGTSVVHNVQLLETLPTSFTISPADTNGWVTGYRYVQFQADSEVGGSSGTTTVGELSLLGANGVPITKTGWLASANSQETVNENTPAGNAIDGNNSTFWGSKWGGGTTPFPHILTVDTGAPRTLTGFVYVPRQSSSNGRVGNYKFLVSTDGISWTQVTTGTFTNSSATVTVTFSVPPSGRAYATLAGPIAPGASAAINITLRSSAASAEGIYTNTAKTLAALDASNSLVADASAINDTSTAVVQISNAIPTPTATPTNTPTNTATNTPVPPTATSTNTVTDTPVPPTATSTNTATNTATDTPVPPTATSTNTATNTATDTPVPPTATSTNIATNTATDTPVPPTATSTSTATNTATDTPVPPTATSTSTATNTATDTPTPPTATSTSTATNTATDTPIPPTATSSATNTATNMPVPPTSTVTAIDTATDTPVPPTATSSATNTATNTPVPPTSTATAIDTATDTPVPPTATSSATNTATNTPVPPTSTATVMDTATDTPVPPTATNTPVPPTSTATAIDTATGTPVTPTSTSTATNTATNTPVPPTSTATVIDTATGTPVPPTATSSATNTATNTPVPPTSTATAIDTATGTPVPPTATSSATNTATNTPVPPTSTATAIDTATGTPVPPTATSSATNTATNTPVPPTSTATVMDTATGTPVPPTVTSSATNTATNTPVPSTATNTPIPPTATLTSTSTHTPTVTPTLPAGNATAAVVPGQEHVLQHTGQDGTGITVTVPGGAINQAITLVYSETNPSGNPGNMLFGGLSFSLVAYHNNLPISNFVFVQPVTVTIKYTDADIAGLNESQLVLYYFNPATQQWQQDGMTVLSRDLSNNRITLLISHLTNFALFAPTLSTPTLTPTATATRIPIPTIPQTVTSTPVATATRIPIPTIPQTVTSTPVTTATQTPTHTPVPPTATQTPTSTPVPPTPTVSFTVYLPVVMR